eukprot:5581611-Prymnesium_polylepis.1
MRREAARARAELDAAYRPVGRLAALHWRMALLVRRWRTRHARRWELNEHGPYEYTANPMVARLWAAAGCQAAAPTLPRRIAILIAI